MAVTLNKANLVLKDANGNIGKIEQLSSNDLAKIRTAVSDVALVVNQSNHTPIEATTTNKGVVQLATSADVASGAIDKVVTAEQLHNVTTGTSSLATENLARIDAVVTEAGIPIDHTNTNQLKTAVTTLISNATPATATANTLGVVKPDNDTITIDSNGVLTATKATQDSVGQQINTTYVKGVTASNATITVTKGNGTTSTATINNVANATNATNLGGYPASNYVRSINGVNTDENGNIELALPFVRNVNNILPDINGSVTLPLPFVKTVNSTAPDSNGNVVLDLSSSGEGVGFPNFSASVGISNFNGTYNSSTTRTYTLPSSGWVMGSLSFSSRNGGSTAFVYIGTSLLYSANIHSDNIEYALHLPLKSSTQIQLQVQFHGEALRVSSSLKFYPVLS